MMVIRLQGGLANHLTIKMHFHCVDLYNNMLQNQLYTPGPFSEFDYLSVLDQKNILQNNILMISCMIA